MKFIALFEDTWNSAFCTDIGANDNIICAKSILAFRATEAFFEPSLLLQHQTFSMYTVFDGGKHATIMCSNYASIYVELSVRHSTSLIFHGVWWLITDQRVGELLLGRLLSVRVGLHSCNILTAKATQYEEIVGIPNSFPDLIEKLARRHVACSIESLYHDDEGADAENLDVDNGWLDLNPKYPEEKKSLELQKLDEASETELPSEGHKDWEKLLKKFLDVTKMELVPSRLSDIEPLKIRLKADAIPVRAKPWNYSLKKRGFLT